ncbi:histidine N-acetyltransferase-like [Spea bombifrons]|uniref:histidine N-acetyltransferase-like n=1 Tax=Spea bombifrons TaxID=233779 RepID=UPI002349EAD5|nr:histidine N-acetyltransferase-like [Spea bombifrons]
MSSVSRSDIQLLPATAGDYEAIMDISGGIYNGVDYLPFRYYTWLNDTNRRMFVAKSEGKVVGFESFLLVDGGITAVLQGLRVAPWMQGHGVAGILQKGCIDTLRSDHPEVTRVRLTRVEDPPAAMLNKYRILHSKAVVSVCIPRAQLEKAIKDLESRVDGVIGEQSIPPKVVRHSEVHSLFKEHIREENLLPGGFLMQAWLPITTHKANLDLMQRWGIHWLCSYPCDVTSSSASRDVMGNVNNSETNIHNFPASSDALPLSQTFSGFLSLGTPLIPVPLGNDQHRLDIDLFGTHPSYAKSHVLFHLKEGVRKLPNGGSIVCNVYAEENLRDELTGFFQGLTPFYLCREQLVLEMEI